MVKFKASPALATHQICTDCLVLFCFCFTFSFYSKYIFLMLTSPKMLHCICSKFVTRKFVQIQKAPTSPPLPLKGVTTDSLPSFI